MFLQSCPRGYGDQGRYPENDALDRIGTESPPSSTDDGRCKFSLRNCVERTTIKCSLLFTCNLSFFCPCFAYNNSDKFQLRYRDMSYQLLRFRPLYTVRFLHLFFIFSLSLSLAFYMFVLEKPDISNQFESKCITHHLIVSK